jgi:hypothetical protein
MVRYSRLTEAMEIEVLKSAFETRGVQVDVFTPASCTADEFISTYEQPKYDVFWVVSHGEFDHWSPSHVKLQIAHDRTIVSSEDLHQRAPERAMRRLPVLNVCDGALRRDGHDRECRTGAWLGRPNSSDHLAPLTGHGVPIGRVWCLLSPLPCKRHAVLLGPQAEAVVDSKARNGRRSRTARPLRCATRADGSPPDARRGLFAHPVFGVGHVL